MFFVVVVFVCNRPKRVSFHSWLGALPGVCSRGVLYLSWILECLMLEHQVTSHQGAPIPKLELGCPLKPPVNMCWYISEQ